MSGLDEIYAAMAAALDDVMGPTALGEDAVQVVDDINFDPQSPTSVDMYPGDPFRGEETAGFGQRTGELIITVRARVNTPDTGGATKQLRHLLDDEHDLCLAAALEADPTLGGLVAQLHVDGDTGYRIFDDPPGQMLGVAWRVRVINATS